MDVTPELNPEHDFEQLRDSMLDSPDLGDYVSRLVGKSRVPDFLKPRVVRYKSGKIRRLLTEAGDIDDFQEIVGRGVEFIIRETLDDLNVLGLDNVEHAFDEANGKGVLFLSTHSHAFTEAALVSWILKNYLQDNTAHSAFGDSFLEYDLIG